MSGWKKCLFFALILSSFLVPAAAQAAEPIARIGPNRNEIKSSPLGALIELDGSASGDPDGDGLTYEWYGPFLGANAPRLTVEVPQGNYEVTLTVNDGTSRSAPVVVNLDVVGISAAHRRPVELDGVAAGRAAVGWRLQAGHGRSRQDRQAPGFCPFTTAAGVAGLHPPGQRPHRQRRRRRIGRTGADIVDLG